MPRRKPAPRATRRLAGRGWGVTEMTLRQEINVVPDRYMGKPAVKLHCWIQGPLNDMLKLKQDRRESDQVTVDPETDLATWSFTIYATTEAQWQAIMKTVWMLCLLTLE